MMDAVSSSALVVARYVPALLSPAAAIVGTWCKPGVCAGLLVFVWGVRRSLLRACVDAHCLDALNNFNCLPIDVPPEMSQCERSRTKFEGLARRAIRRALQRELRDAIEPATVRLAIYWSYSVLLWRSIL